MLGNLTSLYFPVLPESVTEKLSKGGWLLDVGAFNGYWTAEMLVRHPTAQAILIESNPDKVDSILRTLQSSQVIRRARLTSAALATTEGRGWLVHSPEGSWGHWLQQAGSVEANSATEVRTITLDGALGSVRPVIVKCNAEGAEFELVKQIVKSALHPKLIILMVHHEYGDLNELWTSLSATGYDITIARDHPTRPCWHAWLT